LLSSPRGSAAPPDARPNDDVSLMSRTHLIQIRVIPRMIS